MTRHCLEKLKNSKKIIFSNEIQTSLEAVATAMSGEISFLKISRKYVIFITKVPSNLESLTIHSKNFESLMKQNNYFTK